MKKLFYLSLILALFLSACGNSEMERLKTERDSLALLAQTNDETIEDFVQAFNEVESNLETIKQKENIISVKSRGNVELDENSKDKINDDILAIYELMKKNKETITKLEKKLRQSNIKSAGLQKLVASLQEQIKTKDAQIEEMKNNLEKLNINIQELNLEIANLNSDIDTLNQTSDSQKEVIDKQDKELHQAYYIYGSKKELKKHGVVSSKGGFIGIGRMQKLVDNFNKKNFTQVDIRNFKSLPLFAKKAKLVTSHPSSSYYFAGDKKVDSLIIKNTQDFWSVSKYLVIMVD